MVVSHSEPLTNFVNNGGLISLQSMMRTVGNGTSKQDFVGEFQIILLTTSSETSVNAVILGIGERINITFSVRSNKSTRIFLILYEKIYSHIPVSQ